VEPHHQGKNRKWGGFVAEIKVENWTRKKGKEDTCGDGKVIQGGVERGTESLYCFKKKNFLQGSSFLFANLGTDAS